MFMEAITRKQVVGTGHVQAKKNSLTTCQEQAVETHHGDKPVRNGSGTIWMRTFDKVAEFFVHGIETSSPSEFR